MSKLKFILRRYGLAAVFFCTVCTTMGFSQDKKIQLIDKTSQKPIPDCYCIYGDEKSFSDEHGYIRLAYKAGLSLQLSHIKYGKLVVSAKAVSEAMAEGKLSLQSSTKHLLPVTLVQFRQEAGESSNLEISAQNKMAHDAGSLIENVPGISSIRKSGAYGFDPVLRGYKADQLNLVLDGCQTASAACPNRMDPAASQIPINMIAQAEVLKGPHSMRYGNTFGGTINFKSTANDFKEEPAMLGRIGSSYESNGNILRTEGVAGRAGQKIDFRVFGAYSKGDDYTDGDGQHIAAKFERVNWGSKIGFKLNEQQELDVLVSNNRANDVDFPALPMDLRKDNTWLLNLGHKLHFVDKQLQWWNTSLYGTHVDHLMDNYGKSLNPRKVDAETEANTLNFGGRSEMAFGFTRGFLYAGVDYRFESADGSRTRKMLMGPMKGKVFTDNVWQDAQIQRTGLFAEYHLNTPGVQLVLSGRLDYNHSKANNPAEGFSNIYNDLESIQLHPSFSVGGTKLLGKSTSLGIWLGRAKRSPGITERYINQFPVGLDPYEMLGNPDLDAEVNNQIDVVFQQQGKKSQLNINVFTSFLRDYISSEIREDLQPALPTSPGVRQFINIDKALISGFEASWNYQFMPALASNLTVVYTYGKNKELDEPLPEIAPLELKYQLVGALFGKKLQPELSLRKVWEQDRIALSYGETLTPGFFTVDAKATWHINKLLMVSGGVLNLLDEAYYEHLSRSVRNVEKRPIYSPGRSVYLTLTINLL